jgi:Spy/CpxP family protein refolding chaperone
MKSVARWAVCAAVLSTGAAYADAQADHAAKVKAELKKIDARLKLTPEQKDKLKALIEERIDKGEALAKEYRAKMRDVLTTEQQTEWDKIKGEYKAQMKAKPN